jgi:hypothetical protein
MLWSAPWSISISGMIDDTVLGFLLYYTSLVIIGMTITIKAEQTLNIRVSWTKVLLTVLIWPMAIRRHWWISR